MADKMSCPACGVETAVEVCGRWCCPCGARGEIRHGSPVPDREDYDRLTSAQVALVKAICGAYDEDFIEEAADTYSRLEALHLNGNKWGVGMHDGCTVATGWVCPEHRAELEEMLAEAVRIATPNEGPPPSLDGECGKIRCQWCGRLMSPGDPARYTCRECASSWECEKGDG